MGEAERDNKFVMEETDINFSSELLSTKFFSTDTG
jgi:hypothetical protein